MSYSQQVISGITFLYCQKVTWNL